MLLLGLSSIAHAEVTIGGAVGAGGQGEATYSAVEARLDASWGAGRVGLGARGVWLDGELRTSDWDGWKAIRALRLFEMHDPSHGFAVAAGGLAPAQLGHVADGYRATLDDRPRTGVRGALNTKHLALGVELDDVIDPHLIGGSIEVGTTWIGCASATVDPAGVGAVEGCLARRWARTGARLDAGGGVVGERLEEGNGAAAIGFIRGAFDARGVRWTAELEARAGSGSLGGLFGPLHRIEAHVRETGLGAAASFGAINDRGWVRVGVRHRGLGPIATASVGAPAGRYVQVAGWIAASREATAGAAELRVAWARRLTSAIEVGRIYDVEAMDVTPRWTATAWFAVQQAWREP